MRYMPLRTALRARRVRPRYVHGKSAAHCKTADKRNNTAAVFAHFHHVECRDGEMAGCISVHLATDGWFWIIPLPEGTSSVGFVGTQKAFKARVGNPGDRLFERIRQSPTVSARMRAAGLASPVMTAGNYSYPGERQLG